MFANLHLQIISADLNIPYRLYKNHHFLKYSNHHSQVSWVRTIRHKL